MDRGRWRAQALLGWQHGPLRTPEDLIQGYLGATGATAFAEGHVMTCGTVPAIGGIRPSQNFEMELHDPVLQRSLRHRYEVQFFPEVA